MAPSGAVIMMATTAVVRIIVPYSMYYSFTAGDTVLGRLIALSKTIPPIAA